MSASSSFNPTSSPNFNPSSYSPPPHFNPSQFSIPGFNPSPAPPLPSSFRDPIPPSYTASLVGRTTPISPPSVPNLPPPSFQHSFTPPPSSFNPTAAIPRTPIPPTPAVNPPPSFFNAHAPHVRTERLTPSSVSPSLPPSWTAPLSQPPSLPPSLQLPPPSTFNPAPSLPLPPNLSNPYLIMSRPVGSSTIPQPLHPTSLRFPGSNPLISLPPPSFAAASLMPPSLPGPAQWISSFPSFQATLPPRKLNSWETPAIERTPFPSETALVRLPRNYSFSLQPQANFTFKADAKVQQAYRRQFEQNLKMFYQLDAPPERPFSQLPTMHVTQLAFQLDPQTTMFVDPATFINLFQRATSAQNWPVQTQLAHFMARTAQLESRAIVQSDQVTLYFPEKSTASLGQDLAAIALHSVAKVGGLAIEGFLGLSEGFNHTYTPGKPRTSLVYLWRNEAVPAIHRKIDGLCSTNITDNFDSRKDPWYEQLVHSVLANPLSAINLEQAAVKGRQVARQILRLEFALEGASAPRVGKTFTEGLTGQQIASIKAHSVVVEEASFPANIAEQLSANTGGWVLPKAGGAFIDGRWYTEHALERMAPNTPQVMAELQGRFFDRAKIASQKLSPQKFREWYLENVPNPRGIPPSVVKAELAQPGSTNVQVILNEKGHVITVIPGGK